MKVINDGRQPIDDKDFKKPLDFIFAEEAEVLSAEPLSVSPDELKASVTYKANKFTLEPVMLNSRDFIEIKSVISGRRIEFKPDARIVGVRRINQQTDLSSLNPVFVSFSFSISSFIAFVLIASGVLNILIYLVVEYIPGGAPIKIVVGLLLITALVIMPIWALVYYITLFFSKRLKK